MTLGFSIHAHAATCSLQDGTQGYGAALWTWELSLLTGFHWQKSLYIRKFFCQIWVLGADVLRLSLAMHVATPNHFCVALKHVAALHWQDTLGYTLENPRQYPDHWTTPIYTGFLLSSGHAVLSFMTMPERCNCMFCLPFSPRYFRLIIETLTDLKPIKLFPKWSSILFYLDRVSKTCKTPGTKPPGKSCRVVQAGEQIHPPSWPR